MDFPGSPICHLSSFIFISCSCCSLVFLRPNLAVAVAAAIACVALLVLVAVVMVVLVDLRCDGFKNKEREGGGGRAQRLPPKALGGSRRSVPLPCCCSLIGFVVAGFVLYSFCCWLCCRYLEKHRSREAKTSKSKKRKESKLQKHEDRFSLKDYSNGKQ